MFNIKSIVLTALTATSLIATFQAPAQSMEWCKRLVQTRRQGILTYEWRTIRCFSNQQEADTFWDNVHRRRRRRLENRCPQPLADEGSILCIEENARERYQKRLQRDEEVRSHLQSCPAKLDYTLYKDSSLREATVFSVQSGVTLYIVRSHRNYMNQPKTVNGNTQVIFSMGGENVWGWVQGSNPCK